MLNGSEIDSSSRFDGKDSQRNTILGRMLMISTLTTDPNSYKREMTTLTLRKTSTADTPMLLGEPTLLLNDSSWPDNRGYIVSPWGHGLLVGGTVMILHFFLYSYYYYLSPFCSIPFCSTSDPWFSYSPDCCCASCLLALPCSDRWPHTIHKMYPTYDTYWHSWNMFCWLVSQDTTLPVVAYCMYISWY